MNFFLLVISFITAVIAEQHSVSVDKSINIFLKHTAEVLKNQTAQSIKENCSQEQEDKEREECSRYISSYFESVSKEYSPIVIGLFQEAAENRGNRYFIFDEKTGNWILNGNPAVSVENGLESNIKTLRGALESALEESFHRVNLRYANQTPSLRKRFKGLKFFTTAPDAASAIRNSPIPNHRMPTELPGATRSPREYDSVLLTHNARNFHDSPIPPIRDPSQPPPKGPKPPHSDDEMSFYSTSSSTIKTNRRPKWLKLSFNSLTRLPIGRILALILAGLGIYAIVTMFTGLGKSKAIPVADEGSPVFNDPYQELYATEMNSANSLSYDTNYEEYNSQGQFPQYDNTAEYQQSTSSSQFEPGSQSEMYPDIVDSEGHIWKFDPEAGLYYRIGDEGEKIYYQE